MTDLTSFQSELASSIRDPDFTPARFDQPGLSVYRNTVAKGLVDALRASFPTAERLVGQEWFSACALAYARANAPTTPVLAGYGSGFPEFLRSFEPAAEIPYIADVAALDALWTEAHFAADEPVLDPFTLQGLEEEALLSTALPLHASSRALWFHGPIATIWLLNRPPAPTPAPGEFAIDWRAEGLAFSRPNGVVRATRLSHAQFAFLDACRSGARLEQALIEMQSRTDDGDVAEFSDLIAAGLFAVPEPAGSTSDLDPILREPI